jgi:hypothetical protein
MNKLETCDLIVTYVDGTHDHFKFPFQADRFKMTGLVEKLLSSAVLSLQVEDRLLVIPTANIRSAELFPCPKQLPDVVLHNVQRMPRTS